MQNTALLNLILFCLLIAILVVLIITLISNIAIRKKHTYVKQKHLLTRTEFQFYKVLIKSLEGTRLCVFPKVRLGDLIMVSGAHDKEWFRLYAKVAQKHVDFVLCNRETTEIACVVELDDRSHNKEENSRRDTEKNYCCKKAGIALIRIQAAKEYSCNSIYSILRQNAIL